MNELEVRQALGDITAIRRILDKSDPEQKPDKNAARVNIIIQTMALVAAGFILLWELLANEPHMAAFLESRTNLDLMKSGLISVAGFLFVACLLVYLFIRQAAQKSSKEISSYVANNFAYLKRLTFISDLLIKFIIFSLIVVLGHPEWVPVLFILYTADYLFQGRFFSLPLNLELTLAMLCLVAAGFQVFYGLHSLIPALAIFCSVSLISVLCNVKNLKPAAE